MFPFTYRLSINRSRLLSKRDIVSKWSQGIGGGYRHSPVLGETGELMFASANANFPLGVKHQVLKTYLAYQNDVQLSRSYTSFILWPRGYASRRVSEVQSLRIDWVTPLLYPDLNIWFLAYIQRISGGLFFDYAKLTGDPVYDELKSTGVELKFDFNPLRYNFLINLGTRFIYGISDDTYRNELILSLDF